jgi:hypothetical protein
MSSPNSATRALAVFQNNTHRSDLAEAACVALLEAMDAGAVVSDSAQPIRAVLDWVSLNLSESFFTQEFAKRLNSARVREAQGV